MSITKAKPITIMIIFICFLLFVYVNYTASKQGPPDNVTGIQLSGRVEKITKKEKGRYDIEISLDSNSVMDLSDYDFGQYRSVVDIGDSLIKPMESVCFFYKRQGKIVAQNCDHMHIWEINKRKKDN